MIVALIIGRKNSKRLPNKNSRLVGGKPLVCYSISAAINSKHVQRIFLSTDCSNIKKIVSSQYQQIDLLNRPQHLTTDKSLVEDVVSHSLIQIEQEVGKISILVVLFANVATVSSIEIDLGIDSLKNNENADSVVSVIYNPRFSATRAKSLGKEFLEHNVTLNNNCSYFYNGCIWISKRTPIIKMEGQPRFRWLGKNIIPLIQVFGLDINDEKDLILTEYWLDKQRNKCTQHRT